METQIAPETYAALKADATIRFLYKVKFNLDSRHSGPVIAWAESRANAVGRAILNAIGREAASVKIQMVMVQLLSIRKYALLCFDLYLEDCTKPARIQRPIHEVSERGNAYVVWRSKRMDARIATEFARRQNLDKGSLPYFVDTMHPPIYDEGVRVEGPMDAGGSEEENGSGEENESEEENETEDMDTPKKVEEMMNEQMRGQAGG